MTHFMCTLLVVTILLTTLQVVTGPHVYDTGNYMILQEPREENFTLFDGKCRGKLRVITRSMNRYLVLIHNKDKNYCEDESIHYIIKLIRS